MKPDDLEPQESAMFAQFSALRNRAARVLDGFEDRLRLRVDRAQNTREPSAAGSIVAALIELVNVFSRIARPTKSTDTGENDE